MTSLTEALSAFIVETGYDDLPEEAIHKAKHHILDGLGVMLAGSQQPLSRKVLRYAASLGGEPQATVIGSGIKISAGQAAFVNATMGHVLDFDDDSDTTLSHPTVTTLPAVMALGEKGASGRDLLTAYILGLEVCARIASLPGFLPGHYKRGWHTTSTLGVLAATAGCTKIKGLHTPGVRSAFGIAASEAGGLRANFGSMVKALHAGSASAKGVHCTLLAEAGVTANPSVFDCVHGFYDLYGGLENIDTSQVSAGLGDTYDIVTPGINIKKYPCCYYTHAAIDALLFLVDKYEFLPKDIAEIQGRVSSVAFDVLKYNLPKNSTEAKFSMPYCLSRALLNHGVFIDDFADETVRDARNRQWMSRISVAVEPFLDEPGKSLGVCLQIKTTDGHTYSHEILKALGGCENPLTWDSVVSKFESCALRVADEKSVGAIVRDIENLDEIPTIAQIVNHLHNKRPDNKRSG